MSTAARKARKRAGIPFTKPAKTPTPVEERSETKLDADRLIRRVARSLRLAGEQATDEAIAAEIKKGVK